MKRLLLAFIIILTMGGEALTLLPVFGLEVVLDPYKDINYEEITAYDQSVNIQEDSHNYPRYTPECVCSDDFLIFQR